MKFKKIMMALVSALCILSMCVGCSTGNYKTNNSGTGVNGTTDDSKVTDDMNELKDDMKDTATDIKDNLTGDNNTNSSASNSQTAK